MFLGYYVYDKKDDKNYYGCKILDISNHTDIKEVMDFVLINKFWELSGISEDYIYITNGPDGFRIIDITNKKPPNVVGICKTPQSAMCGIVKEDNAYVADVNGLQIIDISDKQNPKVIGSCKIDSGINNLIYINGNYAYTSYRNVVNEETEYGFQIIDITNLENPIKLGNLTVFGSPIDVIIDDNYIYVLEVKYEEDNRYPKLQIIDITNKNNPYIIGDLDLSNLSSGNAYNFSKSGENILIAFGEGGMLVIDTNKKEEPKIISNYKTDGYVLDIYTEDSRAYISDTSKGITILDIKDIKQPKVIGICDTPGYEPYFIIKDNFVFIEYVISENNYTKEIGVQIFKLQ